MATYEYYCAHCSTVIEISHPIGDTPTIICVDCAQPRAKKYSLGAVTFKGGGWGKDS